MNGSPEGTGVDRSLSRDSEVAVIGAGPYGLSIAAHLLAARIPTTVFGRPMEYWQAMPRGMYLRSAWSASNLSAPGRRFSLEEYVRTAGVNPQAPIPLDFFVDYALWFQSRAVPEVDPTYVRCVRGVDGEFELELADGRTHRARRIVVAVGIKRFMKLPAFAAGLPPDLATHSQEHRDFGAFAGKTVAVVGGGQSALETAALLHEAGASVELIARRELVWLRFQGYRGPGHQLLHAPSDVGPPGLNWLIHFSGTFRRLPTALRFKVATRATRPAGARWLHDRVVGRIPLTVPAEVWEATPKGGRLRLELSDGSQRTVDHLLLATGFRPHVDRLDFLAPTLTAQVKHRDGFPVLDQNFQSSVPRLHFVGGLADRSYGPICRFVAGAEPTARRIRIAALRGSG